MWNSRLRHALLVLATGVAALAMACDEAEKGPASVASQEATSAPLPTTPRLAAPSPTPPLPPNLPRLPSGSLVYRVTGWDFEVYRVNVDGSGLTNLSRNPAADVPGAWSPDGRRIAFTSHREGNGDAFIMDANGEAVRNLTKTPEVKESVVSWSPDGRHLLLAVGSNEAGAEFWSIRADGTNRQRLVPFCRGCISFDWSPDGNKLAGQVSAGAERGLYVIDIETGSRKKIADTERAVAVWSPDGEKIAVADDVGISAGGNLLIVRPDGSELRTLHAAPYLGGVSWSPDASRIAFGTSGQVATMAVESGDLQIIARATGVLRPIWSPDGQRIAFTSAHEGNHEIYVIDAHGGEPRNVSNSDWEDVSPLWSPDGTQLIFRSNRDSPAGLYWMRPDGSRQTRFVSGSEQSFAQVPDTLYPGLLTSCQDAISHGSRAACASPDGLRVAAIVRGDEPQEWELVISENGMGEGNNLTPAGVRPEFSPPSWSPTGDKLAFLGWREGTSLLHVLDIATGTAETLTEADSLGNASVTVQWSPDGRYIYYTRGSYCRGGCTPGRLYRIRADGTGEEKLTDHRVGSLFGFVP